MVLKDQTFMFVQDVLNGLLSVIVYVVVTLYLKVPQNIFTFN